MKNAKELLDKYLSGEATSEEKALVESWYLQEGLPPSDLSQQQLQEEYDMGLKALQAQLTPVRRIWPRWAAAAAVLLCVGTAVFYMTPAKQHVQPAVTVNVTEADIPAGSNKAVLTLSNGKKISLTDAAPGSLAREYGVSAEKTADGELVYNANGSANAQEYHTITTPAGGQYQVTLPDGSHVWLNAASSLRYPVKFGQQERLVELSGEAYFEVNKQTGGRPFIVQTGGQQVQVLGTHFNISGYANDAAIKTTLLEGSVRVRNTPGNTVLLKPGQMAVNNQTQGPIRVTAADVEDVMAWKNGLFIFNNEHIRDIMTKLARWYDIDVQYEGDMSGVAFQGNYQRSRSLVNLLKTIEQTNSIRFKIEGRRVTVIKQ
ncbi:FecR family protein [Chitinophaga niabensis]|uniref:FecR protein n=1 Tax=Chitinophaga niabensis TaxID=536979 RepID=A0A1N6FF03_9BACT|nr:FecR family protein [Chitinophaga niabensis]SIN93835.1 FecR protein [Chitinophaga niabensis]